MHPRIFLSGLFHETNTFVERPTVLSDFQISRGEELLRFLGDDSPMDGFLQTAREYQWRVVPGVDYRATPSGPLQDDIFEAFWADFSVRLEKALSDGLEAIFLVLHGAMVTENLSDVEGELLSRIRGMDGAAAMPLFAVLDLHANVSERMAQCATALIPYRENPHTDARDTAIRAARHLRKTLVEGRQMRTYFRHSRILLAPPSTASAQDPMLTINTIARALEVSAGHLEVGVAPGFAHADTPDTGLTFWVVSDRPEMACDQSMEELARTASHFARRAEAPELDLAEAILRIEKQRLFPALLVEPADNIGGGTGGDATFILRALLQSSFEKTAVIINDPACVSALSAIQPGQTARISLGGKTSRLDPGPVEIDVTLIRQTDGKFELEDKQSHLASLNGSRIDMGSCAVVTHRHVTILITSKATPPFDLGQWRSQGIDPEGFQVIGVKAAVGHRQAYQPITRSSFTVQTPGPCTSDLSSLPYQRIRRPIFPLDSD